MKLTKVFILEGDMIFNSIVRSGRIEMIVGIMKSHSFGDHPEV